MILFVIYVRTTSSIWVENVTEYVIRDFIQMKTVNVSLATTLIVRIVHQLNAYIVRADMKLKMVSVCQTATTAQMTAPKTVIFVIMIDLLAKSALMVTT